MNYPRKNLFIGLVVAAVVAVSNGFSTPHQQHHLSPLSTTTTRSSSSSSSSLYVGWKNPFANKDDAEIEAPAPIIIKEELAPGPLDAKNAVAAATWVGLIGWAFLFAPGELGSGADNAMITTLISQPTPRPESINELWFAVWNCFVVVPAVLAALEAPVGKGQRLPATPFLWGSAAFGYFALGPYFATRTVRSSTKEDDDTAATSMVVDVDDMGWFSRNVFENRLYGIVFAAIAISIPFSSDLLTCDWSTTVAGYADLAASSRFVAVASLDIVIMSILAGILVGEDSKRRGWEDKSAALTAISILVPVLSPCLYLAVRPSLQQQQQQE